MVGASMTPQQIKNSLPKYRYLTPGVDVWREGDEWFQPNIYQNEWIEVLPKVIGEPVSVRYCARRPIPPEVLENQAFWVQLNILMDKRALKDSRLFRPYPATAVARELLEQIFEDEAEYRIRTGQPVYIKPVYAVPDYPGEETFIGFDFYKQKDGVK